MMQMNQQDESMQVCVEQYDSVENVDCGKKWSQMKIFEK